MGTESSQVTAIATDGTPKGWPVTVKGSSSPAAYGPDGRIVLTVGSTTKPTSHVAVIDPATHVVTGTSTKLPIGTAEGGVDCVAGDPEAPLVSDDGTIFVTSEIDPRIFALDRTLKVLPGWPYTPSARRVSPGSMSRTSSASSLGGRPSARAGRLYLSLRSDFGETRREPGRCRAGRTGGRWLAGQAPEGGLGDLVGRRRRRRHCLRVGDRARVGRAAPRRPSLLSRRTARSATERRSSISRRFAPSARTSGEVARSRRSPRSASRDARGNSVR